MIKKDPRYFAAIQAHQFEIQDKGSPNYAMHGTYYSHRYSARIKCCYSFAKWANESGLFDEKELNDLFYWITKDNL